MKPIHPFSPFMAIALKIKGINLKKLRCSLALLALI